MDILADLSLVIIIILGQAADLNCLNQSTDLNGAT